MTLEPTRYFLIGADGQEYGPVTAGELREWINEGRANGKTLIRAEKETAWQALANLPELADTLAAKQSVSFSLPEAPRFKATPALVGLGLGIASLLCCCLAPLPLGGITVSSYAIWRIKKGQDNPEEMSLAIIGLILSLIGLLASVLLLIYLLGDSNPAE